MRRYEGVHLPVTASPSALRKELLRVDRILKQMQAGFSNFTKTNQPTAIVSTGTPGSPGGLPNHTHSMSGQGGNFLGAGGGTITCKGLWNFSEGIGIGTVQTTRIFANLSKTYDAPSNVATFGIKTDLSYTNIDLTGVVMAAHQFATTFQSINGANTIDNIENLRSSMTLTNTSDFTAAGLWTNTHYITTINTTKDIFQLIGNRVSVSSSGSGNVAKFEAYAMDNAWSLAAGKSVSEFIIFSGVNPRVLFGNGIVDCYTLRQDQVSTACTNWYFLKSAAPSAGVTNAWGFHISGSGVKSYHQGKIGINDTTPSAMLDATSDNAATPVIEAIGASAQSADWITLMNNAGNSVGLKVPNSGLTTHSYVLPTAQGASGYALTNDGSGNLSWAAAAPANRQRSIFLRPTDFQQLNGTVAPTSATTTSATPKGFDTFVLVDAPAAGPQAFTTQLSIPLDYVSGTAIEVWLHWTETVASAADKTWVFRYHYIVRGDKEDIDGTWTTTSDTLVDNGLTGSGGDYDVGLAYYHAVTRIATDIPSTGLTTAKTMFLTIDRLTTDANDTLNRNIGFIGLELRYTAVL